MQKIKSFRSVTHHLSNLTFIFSAITLLTVLMGRFMHLDLTCIFMTLIISSLIGIITAFSLFTVLYIKHKVFSKPEHISTVMIGISTIVLVLAFIIETAIFN